MTAQPLGSPGTIDDLAHLRKCATSALVADALDALGRRSQVLGHDLLQLAGDGVLVGRAFPVALRPVSGNSATPYTGLLAALDAVSAGEVFVLPSRRATDVGLWGELLSTACAERGVLGVVTDGTVRDLARVRDLRFPTFGTGTMPADISGRYEITAHGVAGVIDGVSIQPGDVIVGDVDGVVVVPQDLVVCVTNLVREKDRGESQFRVAVLSGLLPSEAFERYGVL